MAAKLKPLYWVDAHFCGLRAQTNVYGLTSLTTKEGFTKLIAASISGYFISVEYQKSLHKSLIPITREDVFFGPGIGAVPGPGGEAEIFEVVSVNIMRNDDPKGNVVLGVSYLKLEPHFEQKPSPHLSFYFLPEEDEESSNIMDAIAQAYVQAFSLDFVPFKLTHQRIYTSCEASELCFLLGGSDNKIHMFRQTSEDFSFYEEVEVVEKFYPEFAGIKSCVTQMEFRQVDDSTRLTVLGFQSGLVTLSKVNIFTKEILSTVEVELDSPITSLQLFTQFTDVPCPEFLDIHDYPQPVEKDSQASPAEINLLVTSAIDPSMVFSDVLEKGLSKGLSLPYSNSRDVVLCSCVMDIDFDGENEILIGTYGQMLLAYKFVHEPPTPSMLMTSTPYQSPLPVTIAPLDHSASSSHLVDAERLSTKSEKLESSSGSSGKTDNSMEQDKVDSRRRHRSVAALLDSSDGASKLDLKQDRFRSDELNALLDVSLKDHQTARLVRSQENLSSPSSRAVCFSTPDHLMTSESNPRHGLYLDPVDYPCYRLTWMKRFADPVMGLTCDDVMGDGLMDLVVLTLKGLHVLQPNLNEVAQLLMERMRLLVDPGSEADDDFHQLQKESLDAQ